MSRPDHTPRSPSALDEKRERRETASSYEPSEMFPASSRQLCNGKHKRALGSTPLSPESRIGHAARVWLSMTETPSRACWTGGLCGRSGAISTAEGKVGQVGV
jgi:hypothetical protein